MKRSYITKKSYTWKRKPSQVVVKCKNCGREFLAFPYRIKAGVKACSTKCAGALKQNRAERVCANCGVTYLRTVSQIKHRGAKYCSRQCSNKGYVAECAAKPITDKWGRSNRQADKVWQLAVRERDDYTCQRCGKREPYIHTHHVAPRARRPDLKHVVSNGKCLCNGCHSWVHEHPLEAVILGLLSGETYELARKKLQGEAHGMAKFTASEIKDIRTRHADGERADDIAMEFQVERSSIFRIVRRETYKNVA